MIKRCQWAGADELYIDYHDREWGVPLYDDRLLFEFLILEGMQAGLSWITILHKRKNFQQAFDNFDPGKIASYDGGKKMQLLANPGIIRNRLKIDAAIQNARSFLNIREKSGPFADYIWSFVDGKPKINRWKNIREIPASTPQSDRMSKDLKAKGFKFTGTTICYAFMQAVGMVNDHTIDCFRYAELLSASLLKKQK